MATARNCPCWRSITSCAKKRVPFMLTTIEGALFFLGGWALRSHRRPLLPNLTPPVAVAPSLGVEIDLILPAGFQPFLPCGKRSLLTRHNLVQCGTGYGILAPYCNAISNWSSTLKLFCPPRLPSRSKWGLRTSTIAPKVSRLTPQARLKAIGLRACNWR